MHEQAIVLYQIQRALFGTSRAIIDGDTLKVCLPFEDLKQALVNSGLLQTGFQEDWYISIYPDVAALIESGAVASALEHFIAEGFWSGRLGSPIIVDEDWYRSHYKDVERALVAGDITSCANHFREYGFTEGRAPSSSMLVDEKWYRQRYKAAARQVALGKYISLQQFFNFEGILLGHFANEEASCHPLTPKTDVV
jgi:hypothetical protein